jgi:predicted NodU family carbamoyl transferase
MVILGMHFGHDAAVSVFRDGKEVSYLLRERYVRKKHAISLDEDLILEALNSAGLSYQDIDYCAITSTQDMELMHPNFDSFSIKFEKHADHSGFSTLPSILQQSSIKVEDILIKKVIPRYLSGSNKLNPAYHEHLSEFSPIRHSKQRGGLTNTMSIPNGKQTVLLMIWHIQISKMSLVMKTYFEVFVIQSL